MKKNDSLIWIEKDTHKKIRVWAAVMDITIKKFTREAIEYYIKQLKNKQIPIPTKSSHISNQECQN